MRKTKKAMSPVVGTVLLILITIPISLFLYSFITEPVGKALENKGSQGIGWQLALESTFINNTCLKMTVKNNDDTGVTVALCYVNDVPYTLNPSVHIPRGSLATICLMGNYVKGASYTVKLVSVLGITTQFNIQHQ